MLPDKIVFQNNIIECTNLLTKEYENIYGKELKVKEVVWCVNSSKKMNKVSSFYGNIETIYGVKGLINYLLNATSSTKNDEKHAQDFIDLMYLKYFFPAIYEGGKSSYKTSILNSKRKCYHVDNDGYSEEVGYYGSCYSECIDNTVDFVFMRYKGKALIKIIMFITIFYRYTYLINAYILFSLYKNFRNR